MLKLQSNRYKSILGTIVLLFFSISINTSGYAHPNDPLSIEEIDKAVVVTQEKTLLRRSTNTTTPPLKQRKEILLVERHQQKNYKKDQRLVDIYTYDYQHNELIESLVDLSHSEIIKTSRRQNVQLPLTQNEYKQAKQIIFDDATERQILENEYQRITSQKLTDHSDLYVKAFTFTADSLPNRTNEASKLCGLHRCAQIIIYTGKNIAFEISFIVNLSEGVITQRIGF